MCQKKETLITENINKFSNFVNDVKLLGGGDGPEDWYGDYDIAVNRMSWGEGIKCIIHITDAGAHGKDYSSGDGHPDEGPKLDRIIPKCAEMGFYIFGFNIGSEANKSFERFRSIFKSNGGKGFEIKSFDPNNNIGDNFSGMVVDSAKTACAA